MSSLEERLTTPLSELAKKKRQSAPVSKGAGGASARRTPPARRRQQQNPGKRAQSTTTAVTGTTTKFIRKSELDAGKSIKAGSSKREASKISLQTQQQKGNRAVEVAVRRAKLMKTASQQSNVIFRAKEQQTKANAKALKMASATTTAKQQQLEQLRVVKAGTKRLITHQLKSNKKLGSSSPKKMQQQKGESPTPSRLRVRVQNQKTPGFISSSTSVSRIQQPLATSSIIPERIVVDESSFYDEDDELVDDHGYGGTIRPLTLNERFSIKNR